MLFLMKLCICFL